MKSPQTLVAPIGDFLYEWRFNNWMGVNPSHRPLSAASHCGVYALIRIAVPACGRSRDAIIAAAVRLAGFRVIEDDAGVYVERDTTPPGSTPSLSANDQGAQSEVAATASAIGARLT